MRKAYSLFQYQQAVAYFDKGRGDKQVAQLLNISKPVISSMREEYNKYKRIKRKELKPIKLAESQLNYKI